MSSKYKETDNKFRDSYKLQFRKSVINQQTNSNNKTTRKVIETLYLLKTDNFLI